MDQPATSSADTKATFPFITVSVSVLTRKAQESDARWK
jgi:hypothetical protein